MTLTTNGGVELDDADALDEDMTVTLKLTAHIDNGSATDTIPDDRTTTNTVPMSPPCSNRYQSCGWRHYHTNRDQPRPHFNSSSSLCRN